MSWSEIKKAVNSNLNLPLDKKIEQVEEKVEYVGGVIPRGLVEITKSLTKTGTSYADFVNIDGSGILLYCNYYFQSTYDGAKGMLYIDEGMSTEKTINFVGDYKENTISIDMDLLACVELTDGKDISGGVVVNRPVFFNKLRFNGCTGSNSGNGHFSIKYALLD